MKLYLATLLLACASATAQVATPQSPADTAREQRAAQREYQREHGYLGDQRPADSINHEYNRYERRRWRQYCNEWRERVVRHPRLILPKECRS